MYCGSTTRTKVTAAARTTSVMNLNIMETYCFKKQLIAEIKTNQRPTSKESTNWPTGHLLLQSLEVAPLGHLRSDTRLQLLQLLLGLAASRQMTALVALQRRLDLQPRRRGCRQEAEGGLAIFQPRVSLDVRQDADEPTGLQAENRAAQQVRGVLLKLRTSLSHPSLLHRLENQAGEIDDLRTQVRELARGMTDQPKTAGTFLLNQRLYDLGGVVHECVVKIGTVDNSEHGSGFFISNDGFILTAYHVCRGQV
jgi:hypothetical protein